MKPIKAWAVVNDEGITEGSLIEQNADCSCQAHFTSGAAVFLKRSDAFDFKLYSDKVIPVEIREIKKRKKK